MKIFALVALVALISSVNAASQGAVPVEGAYMSSLILDAGNCSFDYDNDILIAHVDGHVGNYPEAINRILGNGALSALDKYPNLKGVVVLFNDSESGQPIEMLAFNQIVNKKHAHPNDVKDFQ